MRALAAALSMAMLAAAQEPQPPRATFKSTVDLVPVDVSVVDRNGRPVPDLPPRWGGKYRWGAPGTLSSRSGLGSCSYSAA